MKKKHLFCKIIEMLLPCYSLFIAADTPATCVNCKLPKLLEQVRTHTKPHSHQNSDTKGTRSTNNQTRQKEEPKNITDNTLLSPAQIADILAHVVLRDVQPDVIFAIIGNL